MFVYILLRKLVLLLELESFELFFCFLVETKKVLILSKLLGLLHGYLVILAQGELALLHEALVLPVVTSQIQDKELEDELQGLD